MRLPHPCALHASRQCGVGQHQGWRLPCNPPPSPPPHTPPPAGPAELKAVDFGNNSMGKEGAAALADLLRGSSQITDVNINMNDVGNDGAFQVGVREDVVCACTCVAAFVLVCGGGDGLVGQGVQAPGRLPCARRRAGPPRMLAGPVCAPGPARAVPALRVQTRCRRRDMPRWAGSSRSVCDAVPCRASRRLPRPSRTTSRSSCWTSAATTSARMAPRRWQVT